MIYLLHFERPFGHAKHYLGTCADGSLDERLERHRSGRGSRLLAAVTAAGIGWVVARTWRGSREQERRMKNRGHSERCPICRGGWRRPALCKT